MCHDTSLTSKIAGNAAHLKTMYPFRSLQRLSQIWTSCVVKILIGWRCFWFWFGGISEYTASIHLTSGSCMTLFMYTGQNWHCLGVVNVEGGAVRVVDCCSCRLVWLCSTVVFPCYQHTKKRASNSTTGHTVWVGIERELYVLWCDVLLYSEVLAPVWCHKDSTCRFSWEAIELMLVLRVDIQKTACATSVFWPRFSRYMHHRVREVDWANKVRKNIRKVPKRMCKLAVAIVHWSMMRAKAERHRGMSRAL